jgi:hypothetical protein
MKPTKKKPAKRRNPIVGKLLDLKYRMNESFRNDKDTNCVDRLRADKGYVMNLIDGVRKFNWKTISKEDGVKCNALWRKYEG